jgi:phosphonate transport system substrate-binding protein
MNRTNSCIGEPTYSLTASSSSVGISLFFLFNYVIGFFFIAFAFSSCTSNSSKSEKYQPSFSKDSSVKNVLLFGTPSQSYFDELIPIVNYLNNRLQGAPIRLIASVNISDYFEKLNNHYFDITIFNGFFALEAERNGYDIVGKVSGDEQYYGVIIVHKDSAFNQISDLKGRSIAVLDETSLAAAMMPLYYIHQQGVDINKDVRKKYFPSIESAILNVYMGKCDAATSNVFSWELFRKKNPEMASRLVAKWQTKPLPNVAVLFKENMNTDLGEKIKSILFDLHKTEEGRQALKPVMFSGFEKADSNTYRPIRDFAEKYKAAIH